MCFCSLVASSACSKAPKPPARLLIVSLSLPLLSFNLFPFLFFFVVVVVVVVVQTSEKSCCFFFFSSCLALLVPSFLSRKLVKYTVLLISALSIPFVFSCLSYLLSSASTKATHTQTHTHTHRRRTSYISESSTSSRHPYGPYPTTTLLSLPCCRARRSVRCVTHGHGNKKKKKKEKEKQ